MSQLIVFKCVDTSQNMFYVEINTGACTVDFYVPNGGTLHNGPRVLMPQSNIYEGLLALRFAKTPSEATAALKEFAFPSKVTYELLRVETIATRLTLDLSPPVEKAVDSSKAKELRTRKDPTAQAAA